MLLILFLMVEIEPTFVFPKIMLDIGKKGPKNVAFSKSKIKIYLKYLTLLFYGW